MRPSPSSNTRPALDNKRVQTNAKGLLVLNPKTPWRDGIDSTMNPGALQLGWPGCGRKVSCVEGWSQRATQQMPQRRCRFFTKARPCSGTTWRHSRLLAKVQKVR